MQATVELVAYPCLAFLLFTAKCINSFGVLSCEIFLVTSVFVVLSFTGDEE
jgi:hypothetical protein